MQFHVWEGLDPQTTIDAHGMAMDSLMSRADMDIAMLRMDVQRFMNVQEIVWGWKKATTDRDTIDLLSEVMVQYPSFKMHEVPTVDHMIAILRAEPGKAVLTRPETMEDHYQPKQYTKRPEPEEKPIKPAIDLEDAVGALADLVQTVSESRSCATSHSHNHSHDTGGSYDSGGGGSGGCD